MPRLQDSKHERRVEKRRRLKDTPDIPVVPRDDVDFGLPDSCGGPIHTPTLTRVANQGASDNGFYTTAIRSPSRAAPLAGRNRQRGVPHDR